MASQHSSDEVCTQTQPFEDCTSIEDYDADRAPSTKIPKIWAAMVSLADNIRYELQSIDEDGSGNAKLYLHSIGRSKKCTIPMNSPTISNRHCNIYCKINEATDPSLDISQRLEAWIEDLSNNGTYINKTTRLVKSVPRLLHNNDEIYLINPSFNRAADGTFCEDVKKNAFLFMLFLPCAANDKFPTRPPSAVPTATAGSIARSSTVARMLKQNRFVQEYYELRGKLGEGAMGSVYEGINKANGSRWAVKCIDYRKLTFNSSVTTEDVVREAELIRKLRHPNIIHLEDVFSDERSLYLVMELSQGGDLFDRIVSKNGYSENEAREVMRQLLSAMIYLHDNKVAHRDLKPENILLQSRSNDVDIKITDFGLAKQLDETSKGFKTLVGTPQYFAPEVLARQHTTLGLGTYDVGADMWSIGVVLYVMLSCNFPSPDPSIATQFNDCAAWSSISADAKHFISSLLVVDPKRRLSSRQAIQHRWISAGSSSAGATEGTILQSQLCTPMELAASTVLRDALDDVTSPLTVKNSCSTVETIDSKTQSVEAVVDESSRDGPAVASMHVSDSVMPISIDEIAPMDISQPQLSMFPAVKSKTVVPRGRAAAAGLASVSMVGKRTNNATPLVESSANGADVLEKRPRRSAAKYS